MLSEAIAKISVVGLKVREVTPVTKFIIAFIGFGFFSWRQESWLYMFTTPQLELQREKWIKIKKKQKIWINSNEMDETGAHYTEWSKPER